MEWSFPDSGIINGFKLYQRAGDGEYDYDNPVMTLQPTDRTLTLSLDPTPGETHDYYFVLRAFSDTLESDSSNEVHYISVGTPPLKPVNLTGEFDKENSQISLEWTQPDDPDGYLVERWYVFYRLEGETDLTQIGSVIVPVDETTTNTVLATPFEAVEEGQSATVYFTVLAYRRSGVQSEYADAFSLFIDRTSGSLEPPSGLNITISLPVQ